MKVCLVEVNWALLFFSGLMLTSAICSIVQMIIDSKARKEIVRQNELIREQNSMILKQNGQLATVIVRVCSKSVMDRRKQNEEVEKGNAPTEAESYPQK